MARAKNNTKNNAKKKEVSAAVKTFKSTSEVSDFYRYIHENGIRTEAHTLMKVVLQSMKNNKKKKVLH